MLNAETSMTFKPQIRVGQSIILESGTLLVEEKDVITFEINLPDGKSLRFKFQFKQEGDGQLSPCLKYAKQRDEEGIDYLEIDFINMEKSRLTGNINRTQFATLLGAPLTFKFRITAIPGPPINYVVNYTWYWEMSKTDIINENEESK